MGAKDRLVWMSTKNGQYTVLSGYTVEQTKRKQARGDEGSNNRNVEEEGKMWKKVWNLNIKQKIKHFL